MEVGFAVLAAPTLLSVQIFVIAKKPAPTPVSVLLNPALRHSLLRICDANAARIFTGVIEFDANDWPIRAER